MRIRHPQARRRHVVARRTRLYGATLPVAGVVTLLASAVGVGLSNDFGAEGGSTTQAAMVSDAAYLNPLSRSAARPELVATEPEVAAPEVAGKRWVVLDTNVRERPSTKAEKFGVVAAGKRVTILDRTAQRGRWVLIQYGKRQGWMITENLSEEKPPAISTAACASGSGVEGGLASTTIAVHRAVCAAFPSVTRYGGLGGGGAHATGHALDIMVSGDLGWEIAEYVRAHAAELGVTQVIYSQRIWTTQLAGAGWRPMSDRGSSTANHYDHVHVTTG